MVVRSGTKVSLLRHDAVLPDGTRSDAIKRHLVANPTMIANYHLQGKGTRTRPDQHVATDFGPEEPQSEPSPRIKRLWRRKCSPYC